MVTWKRLSQVQTAVQTPEASKWHLSALASDMTVIVLVRHGQAEHNVAFDSLGDAAYEDPQYQDSRLTPTGARPHRAFDRKCACFK